MWGQLPAAVRFECSAAYGAGDGAFDFEPSASRVIGCRILVAFCATEPALSEVEERGILAFW
jgi:hypothetical protein